VILEGIVTTLSHEGKLNIAPMGPRLGPDLSTERFELRPYRTSTTYRNLKQRGEGVFHITDDVLLLAQAAIGVPILPEPELRPAEAVSGWILAGTCRFYEFRVVELDDQAERTRILVETVASGSFREFLGFNRARHSIVEAAILATRTAFLPRDEILAEYEKLAVIVAKTGGPAEDEAYRLLREYVRNAQEASSVHSITARP
jgi:hypothetical protein